MKVRIAKLCTLSTQFSVKLFLFLGHERDDVVCVRKNFVEYLSTNKTNYYNLSEDDGCNFIQPQRKEDVPFKRTILISHDESTFRSGDTSKFKWMFPGKEPLFSKGRKRSLMVSDFVFLHPSGPFFELSDDEWLSACRDYPELEEESGLEFLKNGASSFIALNGDNYFDNETILFQFERLFKLLKFKKDFDGFHFEFLVDNATTHTTKEFSIDTFRKGTFNTIIKFRFTLGISSIYLRYRF